MSVASANVGGDLRVGNVLSRAFEICGANFVLFGAVMLVVSLPTLIFTLQAPLAEVSWTSGIYYGLETVLGIFLNTIGEAVILFGAFQYLRGQPVVPGEALQRSLARFFPIVGFAILYTIALVAGFILLVVPGIIWFVMWTVALPACVVEGLGPGECMQRSAELTKGYRWKIFGIMILLWIISAIVGGIVNSIAGQGGIVTKALIGVLWSAAWSTYWNCVQVMIYHDLRVVKEGIDTAQIASIFD
jgi:hypothetical protein